MLSPLFNAVKCTSVLNSYFTDMKEEGLNCYNSAENRKHVITVAAYETCLKIRAENRKGLIIPMGFMQIV